MKREDKLRKETKEICKYNLGEGNNRKYCLIKFCTKHRLSVGSTLHKNRKKRICKQKKIGTLSPCSFQKPEDRGKPQVCYFMINQRSKDQIMY